MAGCPARMAWQVDMQGTTGSVPPVAPVPPVPLAPLAPLAPPIGPGGGHDCQTSASPLFEQSLGTTQHVPVPETPPQVVF